MPFMEIESLLVHQDASILKTIEILDKSGYGIVLITDENSRLIGLITDGDVRRGLLRGISLNDSVQKIMTTNFTFVTTGYSQTLINNLFQTKPIKHIPVLNKHMNPVDIILKDDVHDKPCHNNYTIIMAGGLGTRLRPLTNEIPKPMLKVGTKPILETIIDQLKSYGFINIILSVNYKAEMIEHYFQDGSNFGVNISYLHEDKPLGTGGAIKLAQDKLRESFFVINGDLLTKLHFDSFLDHHLSHGNLLTIATRKQELQIPYGVVDLENDQVVKLVEKPVHQYFINGGMYCVEPQVLRHIPDDTFFNMTDLASCLLRNHNRIGSFPIHEYWMDIGQMNDYYQANSDYNALFGGEMIEAE